jgi:ABC-type phosphate transport system auxiliary subunit
MECGQKHVALANEQVEVAQHVLNDKMSIIDRLSAAAKERVDADRNRIMKQAETEREQAFAKIDQIAELQKKQIRDKHTQLSELPLDEIPSFIQHMTNEMEYVSETNNRLFRVNSTLPKIQVEHGISTKNEKL